MPTDHRGNIVGNPTTSHGGHRSTPRIRQAISEHLGVSDTQAEDVINAHRAGNVEEVYTGSQWDLTPEDTDLQNKVTKSGGIKEAITDSLYNHKMNMKHGYGWDYNPESAWSKRG